MARARSRSRLGPLSPAFIIRSRAMSKGVLGGSRGWQVVAAVIFGRRLLRRILGNEAEILTVDEVKPGQLMQIEPIGPKDPRHPHFKARGRVRK